MGNGECRKLGSIFWIGYGLLMDGSESAVTNVEGFLKNTRLPY